MDFFEYASLVSSFIVEEKRWVGYIVGGLCFAIIFIFQAVALYVISGREGYKNRWFALKKTDALNRWIQNLSRL